jgi:hypothetical protein
VVADEGSTVEAPPEDDASVTELAAGELPEPDREDAKDEAAGSERCQHHPARAAVARCAGCDRPLCVSCAVPVRGRVFGPECVADELGEPGLTVPPEPERSHPVVWVAVAGAGIALVGTIGPWTRTGAGDRVFGAWVPNVRWSMVAAVAAIVLAVGVWRLAGGRDRAARLVIVTGSLVAVASALAIAFPPTFQAASWGPWLGVAGGAIAAAAGVGIAAFRRHPPQGV